MFIFLPLNHTANIENACLLGELIINAMSNPEIWLTSAKSAMHYAIEANNLDLVRQLCEVQKVQMEKMELDDLEEHQKIRLIDGVDDLSVSPLHLAIRLDFTSIALYLIDMVEDINPLDDIQGKWYIFKK